MDDDPPDTPDGGAPDGNGSPGDNPDGGLPPGGAPPQADPSPGPAPADTPPSDTKPADSGPVVTNSVSMSPQNPVVRPRVRNIRQFDAPWGGQSVRRNKERNITGDKVTKYDSWTGNGCFPTVMTIVLNWLANYHGPTNGQMVFPKPPVQTGDFGPVDLSKMMGSDGFADCSGKPWKDEDATKYGYKNDEHMEYSVNASNFISGVAKTTAPAGSGNQVALARTRLQLTGTADAKAAVIKQYLHYGPVMVNMTHPGHWVVIDAFVGNKIYICDPGVVMQPNGLHYSIGGTPVSADEMPAGVTSTQGYYTIDATGTVVSLNKNYQGKWLDSLINLDVIYVPDPSDTSSPRKPFYPHQDFDIQGPMNADTVAAPTGASETTPAAGNTNGETDDEP